MGINRTKDIQIKQTPSWRKADSGKLLAHICRPFYHEASRLVFPNLDGNLCTTFLFFKCTDPVSARELAIRTKRSRLLMGCQTCRARDYALDCLERQDDDCFAYMGDNPLIGMWNGELSLLL